MIGCVDVNIDPVGAGGCNIPGGVDRLRSRGGVNNGSMDGGVCGSVAPDPMIGNRTWAVGRDTGGGGETSTCAAVGEVDAGHRKGGSRCICGGCRALYFDIHIEGFALIAVNNGDENTSIRHDAPIAAIIAGSGWRGEVNIKVDLLAGVQRADRFGCGTAHGVAAVKHQKITSPGT